jgi:hypothetical protein
MRKVSEDADGKRLFYLCPGCGYQCTFCPYENFLSDGWPREVFDEAVRSGAVTADGKPA